MKYARKFDSFISSVLISISVSYLCCDPFHGDVRVMYFPVHLCNFVFVDIDLTYLLNYFRCAYFVSCYLLTYFKASHRSIFLHKTVACVV